MSCSWEEIAATLREVFHVLSGVALVGAILQYWCYLLLADHIGRISRLHPSEMGSMVVIPAIADQATSYNFDDSQQGQDRCLLSYKSYPGPKSRKAVLFAVNVASIIYDWPVKSICGGYASH